MDNTFIVRKIQSKDKQWIAEYTKTNWNSTTVISRRKAYKVDDLPGFIAIQDNDYVGLVTINIENTECQIVTIAALIENLGIGTQLIRMALEHARHSKCKRIWLITTNDNTYALRFFQKRGFKLKALYCNEIEYSRELKPEIPTYGFDSIPIRDEIELEIILPQK